MKNASVHEDTSAQGKTANSNTTTKQAPVVTGQRGKVLEILRQGKPVLNVALKQEHGITESNARLFELRQMGYNIATIHHAGVYYKGRTRRHVAEYLLLSPEWPAPGFLEQEEAEA